MAKVIWQVEGAVRSVLLNRPDKRNALDAEMIARAAGGLHRAAGRRASAWPWCARPGPCSAPAST